MKLVRLIIWIFICQSAGIIGSIATYPAIPTWYAALNKPVFNPPNWIFGPVWITLFTLMGIAAFLIWENGWEKKEVKIAITVFIIHLAFNSLWSILFFGLQAPLYAFVEIIFLWLLIAASIILFYRISKPAGIILVPYLLWVSFASVLNYFIMALN